MRKFILQITPQSFCFSVKQTGNTTVKLYGYHERFHFSSSIGWTSRYSLICAFSFSHNGWFFTAHRMITHTSKKRAWTHTHTHTHTRNTLLSLHCNTFIRRLNSSSMRKKHFTQTRFYSTIQRTIRTVGTHLKTLETSRAYHNLPAAWSNLVTKAPHIGNNLTNRNIFLFPPWRRLSKVGRDFTAHIHSSHTFFRIFFKSSYLCTNTFETNGIFHWINRIYATF